MRLQEVQRTANLNAEELVDELVAARAALEAQERVVWWLERSVVEAMDAKGAEIVKTDSGTAKISRSVSYDYGILAGLREITSPEDLIGYTPEREVTKTEPERWNMTQAKTLAKLSSQHRAIIDNAKIEGAAKIKFQPKKGDS
jgi:hypothetical protein